MRPILIVVSAPILQLFLRVGKRQEPMGVQALRPEAAIEGLNERIVRCLAGTREPEARARHEFQDDVVPVSPQIKVAGDKLRPLIDPDRLRIADNGAGLVEHAHHVLAAVAEAGVEDRREPGERVDHCENPDLLAGRKLVVDKVHRPGFVRPSGLLAIVS